jgi:hypothetical protein
MRRSVDSGLPLAVVALAIAFALALGLFALALRRISAVSRRLDGVVREEQLAAMLRPLEQSERLRGLDEQLRGLRDDLARRPKALEASDLAPLIERIARLEVILGDLRIRIDEQRARTEYVADDEGGLPGRLQRSLAQRGFEMVHVLADVVEGSNAEELRIPVEARRGGMTYKGTVTVADGRVTEVALKPATEVFP